MDIERIIVRMMADATQYNRTMNQVESRMAAFAHTMGGYGNLLVLPFTMAARAAGALTGAIAAASVGAIVMAGNYEKAAIAFEVMTGSAEKSKDTLQDLYKLAIETPFKFFELVDAAKQIKAFGFETDQIIPILKVLGEASSGTGTKLERIILAFGQVRVATRLMGPELRQLVDAGIPMFDFLGKVMKKPTSAIKGLVEEGKVSYADFARSFNLMAKSVGEGGLFGGFMERQSRSFLGRWSAFIETLQLSLKNLGETFIKVFGLTDMLDKWREALGTISEGQATAVFADLKDTIDDIWTGMKTIYAAIIGIAKSAKTWLSDNESLVTGFMRALGLIVAIYGVVTLLSAAWTVIALIFSPAGMFIIGLTALMVLLDKLEAFEGIGDSIANSFKSIGGFMKDSFGALKNFLESGDLEGAFKVVVVNLKVMWKELVFGMRMEFEKLLANITNIDGGQMSDNLAKWMAKWRMDFKYSSFNYEQSPATTAAYNKELAGLYKGIDDASKNMKNVKVIEWDTYYNAQRKAFEKNELGPLTGQMGGLRADAYLKNIKPLPPSDPSREAAYKMYEAAEMTAQLTRGSVMGSHFTAMFQAAIESQKGDAGLKSENLFMPAVQKAMAAAIRIPFMISPEAKELVSDVRREMEKEYRGGIGGVGGRMGAFEKQMGYINEARYGPLGMDLSGRGLFGRAIGKAMPGGLMNDDEAKFARFLQFDALRKAAGADREDHLPRAMLRGSQEAQDTINRQNMQVSLLEEIRNTFLRTEYLDEEKRKYLESLDKGIKQILEERRNAHELNHIQEGGFFN